MIVDAQAVMYADPTVDVTNELVRKYNARHKAAPAAAAKADPKKAPKAEKKK